MTPQEPVWKLLYCGRVIDLHCHILPGVDDGVRSIEEARELAARAADEGVVAIAATPHVRIDYPTTAERMEEGVEALRADFVAQGIKLDVLHGGEIELGRLWEIPRHELVRLSLAQTGRYVLLEFPYRGWPLALDSAVRALRRMEVRPLLAHPERNPEVQDRPERLSSLIEAGALIQVTAASLDGRLDRASQHSAHRMVELGFVHVLATDAHGPHIREAGLAAAAETLEDGVLARYLTIDAPAAIIAGDPLPPIPAR
jgi:protein-tyrosine phosphatase